MKKLMPVGHQSRVIKAVPFWPSSPWSMGHDTQKILDSLFDFVDMTWPSCQGKDAPQGPHPHLPYLAGREEDLATSFSFLLGRKDLDLIWTVRGGYGALRWAARISGAVSPHGKVPLVLGFSDVSFIHLALFNMGLNSIHGPMLATLKDTSRGSLAALRAALLDHAFPTLKGTGYKGGRSIGRLLAVNLSCLAASLGTPLEPDLDTYPTILAIEDHNEPLYRIDRLLTQLREAGLLHKAKGIAIGEVFLTKAQGQDQLKYLIDDLLAPLTCPIVLHLPFGHGKRNMPLFNGGDYLLDGDYGALIRL